jgi:hypothetical protein
MKIKVQITVQSDEGQAEVVQEVAHLERALASRDTRAELGRSVIDLGRTWANLGRAAVRTIGRPRAAPALGSRL